MWNTKLYLISVILICIPLIFADEGLIETYKPNAIIDLSVHVTNLSGEVIGANCSAQIRNSSLGVIENINFKEINNGWYNATYNTSITGKYFCRTNCTLGSSYTAGTCDFIIKGDSEMQIAIILVMAVVITFLFVLSRYIKIEAFKYLLIAVASMVVILTINIGFLMAKENLSAGIQSLISTTYLIVLYTLEFILGLGVIFVMLYYVAKWLPDTIKSRFMKR